MWSLFVTVLLSETDKQTDRPVERPARIWTWKYICQHSRQQQWPHVRLNKWSYCWRQTRHVLLVDIVLRPCTQTHTNTSFFFINSAPYNSLFLFNQCSWVRPGTLSLSRKNQWGLARWFIRGSALGPIGGLGARQFSGCLPRREEKRREERGLASRFLYQWSHSCHLSPKQQHCRYLYSSAATTITVKPR